jgi:hypothetical protein
MMQNWRGSKIKEKANRAEIDNGFDPRQKNYFELNSNQQNGCQSF